MPESRGGSMRWQRVEVAPRGGGPSGRSRTFSWGEPEGTRSELLDDGDAVGRQVAEGILGQDQSEDGGAFDQSQ
jgi:hypothetical protein